MNYWQKHREVFTSLLKRPGFVAIVMTTLGTAMGVLLCALTVGYHVFFKPLPYPNADDNYFLQLQIEKDGKPLFSMGNFPLHDYVYHNSDAFSSIAMIFDNSQVLSSDNEEPKVQVRAVTQEYMAMFDVTFALGHGFGQQHKLGSLQPDVLLSYDSWQRFYQKDPSVIGQHVVLNDQSFRIIGVIAEEFQPVKRHIINPLPEFIIPYDMSAEYQQFSSLWGRMFDSSYVVAQLKPSLHPATQDFLLSSEVNQAWREQVEGIAFFDNHSMSVQLVSLRTAMQGDSELAIYLMLLGGIGLLLITLANVINLFFARVAEQQSQLSIRAAVGASPLSLWLHIHAEALQVLLPSALVAVGIAYIGFELMGSYMADILPLVHDLSIDSVSIIICVLLVLVLSLFIAILSMRTVCYGALVSGLQSSGKGTSVQVSKTIRRILVVSQIAIMLMIVTVAGYNFIKASTSLLQPLAFDVENTLEVRIDDRQPRGIIPETEQQVELRAIQQKLDTLSTVQSSAFGSNPLFNGIRSRESSVETGQSFLVRNSWVSHEFFSLLDIALLEGELFLPENQGQAGNAVVINQTFAESLTPGSSAIGQQITLTGGGIVQVGTVIGVVEDLTLPGTDAMNGLYRQQVTGTLQIKLLEGQSLPRTLLLQTIKSVNPRFQIDSVQRVEDMYVTSSMDSRIAVVSGGVLTLVSVVLASIGLYGVMSYSINMRRGEIATRLALGATYPKVIFLLCKELSLLMTVGIGIALAILAMGSEALLQYSYDIESLSALDMDIMVTILVSAIAMTMVSCLTATLLPMRQVMKHSINYSLRNL